MKKTTLALSALAALSCAQAKAQPQSPEWFPYTLNANNIPAIVDAILHNEPRFNQYYKDAPILASGSFISAGRNPFVLGVYTLEMMTAGHQQVGCSTRDPVVLVPATGWKPGHPVSVSGTVDTMFMGVLEIENCRLSG